MGKSLFRVLKTIHTDVHKSWHIVDKMLNAISQVTKIFSQLKIS
jgi:hypothetical protein